MNSVDKSMFDQTMQTDRLVFRPPAVGDAESLFRKARLRRNAVRPQLGEEPRDVYVYSAVRDEP